MIEFLITNKQFSEVDLNKIWDAASTDDEIMKEVYKIIQDCAIQMPLDLIEKVLSKINLGGTKLICSEEIDLLCGLGKA